MTEKYQIKKWIENIIKSSNTWDQLVTCEKLIENFKNQMKKEDYDGMLSLPFIVDLKTKIDFKRRDLIQNNLVINN
jgi:HD-GYP domain-containing protein (c-di-GMP phosphodiesterase class II)